MATLPRIITVDPSRTVARIVRSVLDLTDRAAVQIDVPTSAQALEEVQRGGCRVLIATYTADDDITGFDLAQQARYTSPETAVIILADIDDPAAFDAETQPPGTFVYLHRPVEIHQFMRVLLAGMDGKDIFAAYEPNITSGSPSGLADLGDPPLIDLYAAERICDRVLNDVNAKSVILFERTGRALIERGAIGFIDRARLTEAMMPSVLSTIEMGKLVGGRITTMSIYDGDDYDIFVLALGLHHVLSIVFDGQSGTRQLGGVSRYGRRAADDLIALLGPEAYLLERPAPPPADVRRPHRPVVEEVEEEPVLLARAEELTAPTPEPQPEEQAKLEPISDLDVNLFDAKQLNTLDESDLDDLFDPEKLAEIANESRSARGPLSYEEARELGIIP